MITEPYWRLLDENDGGGAGTCGKAGARTETFAIGSVFYTLLRGHELYKTESWGRDHFVILAEKFQRKEFPQPTKSAGDVIIRKCWNGEYRTVGELLAEFTEDAGEDEAVGEGQEWLEMRQMECEAIIQSGWVDALDRY